MPVGDLEAAWACGPSFLRGEPAQRAWRVAIAPVRAGLREGFPDGGCADSSTLDGRNSYSSATAGLLWIICDTAPTHDTCHGNAFNPFRMDDLSVLGIHCGSGEDL
jgi:hypothetical protein